MDTRKAPRVGRKATGATLRWASSIFAALPIFWFFPPQFMSGAVASAGIALINSAGNVAVSVAPYITGAVKDLTGSYQAPMFIVGGFMLLSAVLAFSLKSTLKLHESSSLPSGKNS